MGRGSGPGAGVGFGSGAGVTVVVGTVVVFGAGSVVVVGAGVEVVVVELVVVVVGAAEVPGWGLDCWGSFDGPITSSGGAASDTLSIDGEIAGRLISSGFFVVTPPWPARKVGIIDLIGICFDITKYLNFRHRMRYIHRC